MTGTASAATRSGAGRPRIALVTNAMFKHLRPEEQPLLPAFDRRGYDAIPAIWNDSRVRWDEFDAVVSRTPWGYYRRIDEFRDWLDRLESIGMPVWNPTGLLRWNSEKSYLREIESRGAPVVPTVWLDSLDAHRVATVLDERGWGEGVVKPVVSAGAVNTWRVTRGEAMAFPESTPGAFMVQPFLRSIVTEGEWSLIFIGGALSHTIVKRPAAGDFRVQVTYGGTAERRIPPDWMVDDARRALDAVPWPWMYARVDGVVDGGRFLVIELEMLEPDLFFPLAPEAVGRFADAVVAALSK